eukprot:scaffold118718_cov66-Phaeocystis_antarctica.AAC.3
MFDYLKKTQDQLVWHRWLGRRSNRSGARRRRPGSLGRSAAGSGPRAAPCPRRARACSSPRSSPPARG